MRMGKTPAASPNRNKGLRKVKPIEISIPKREYYKIPPHLPFPKGGVAISKLIFTPFLPKGGINTVLSNELQSLPL